MDYKVGFNMVSTTLVKRKSELKSLIPLLSISGFIFLTNSSFAASPSEIEESEKKIERPPTLTITATREYEVQKKSNLETKHHD